jgi:hypothetical protein
MKYSIVITSRTEYLQKWLELYLVRLETHIGPRHNIFQYQLIFFDMRNILFIYVGRL